MPKDLKIIFTNTLGVPEEYAPKPASKYVPEWYKNLDSYVGGIKEPDGQGHTTGTIKRCMPVFDAINSGYIIPTPCDVWVKQFSPSEEDKELKQPFYQWSRGNAIEFHPIFQVPNHPNNTGHTESLPKWINPWSIKTSPGYSVMFVQPFHRESIFTILPGVVDTDIYHAPVNFPFVLNDIKFEGLIPAGTPIAQVIPFKRESWQMEFGNETDFINQQKSEALARSRFFDGYKTFFRQKKEYK